MKHKEKLLFYVERFTMKLYNEKSKARDKAVNSHKNAPLTSKTSFEQMFKKIDTHTHTHTHTH
jgi:hypothetical protein